MAFPATNLAELPFRNSLSLSTHSPPALNLNLLFVAPKRSFQLLKPLSSLKNPHYSGNRNPRNNRSTPSSKPKPPSAPWLANDLGEPKVAEKVSKSNTEGQNDRGQGAVERIVLRLRNLGLGSDDDEEDEELEEQSAAEPVTGEEKLGDLLRRDWGRPESLLDEDMEEGTVLPWEREEEKEVVVGGRIVKMREGKPSSLAELTLEDEELRRLRTLAMQHREKINVPKAGITQAVLDKIHGKWKKDELVKLKFHEVLAHDMKTAHEIVERRTGGLVIWKSGSVMMVFRGHNYKGPSSRSQPVDRDVNDVFIPNVSSAVNLALGSSGIATSSLEKTVPGVSYPDSLENMTEEEAEYHSLMDGLGPRFVEWWGTGVLPVDADLLPEEIPGYKTPYRFLPAGMRSHLTTAEMTNHRKLARKLPCHFALGRNRHHQGLAAAIVKLWEKSTIAKIAVKRGIQNTNNKLMAEEIKALTGGVLLLRNKFYIVIYRGKDFVPPSVETALAERQELTERIQSVEEEVRVRATAALLSGNNKRSTNLEGREELVEPIQDDEQRVQNGAVAAPSARGKGEARAGTLEEFYEARARWGREISIEEREKMIEEASLSKRTRLVKRVEHKLGQAQAKKLKAEKLLSKIEASMVTAGPDYDQETITDEERVMFRMIGLRMKPYLPLGVRGVFDGVIENMHLHWKHRELVKLITGQKNLAFVEDTARLLEFESGGILVAIERLPKGHAVIYYRGKNYQRPVSLRPRNLLTKAKALKRSVAMQRHEALSEHISGLEATIEQMKKDIVSDHLPPLKPFTSISSPSTAQSRHELPLRVTAQPPLSFFSALSSFVPSPANELPPNFTPEQLIEALHRQKDEASVLRVFNWASKQPNFTPTSFLYNEVLRRLGSVRSMRRFLDEMKLAGSDKITTGNFPILAQTYADSEMYEEALRVVDLMEGEFGLKPDRYFYNCLLNILVEGSKLKLVENAHSDMVNRGIKPNVSTFNILIKALCRAHQIRPAILLMEEMPSLGLAPDETTFVTLMQGYIDEGDLYNALKVKGQMMEAGCPWSNKMVNVLINGFCKAGRIEDALGFIYKMCTEGFYPDQFTFNTLVSGLSKEGHVDQATEIMDIMFEHGFDPDIFTYNCLITALCKLGEVGEAAELLSLMISRDCYPNTVTFNILIGTLCKENKIDEATELARFLASKGVVSDVCTFNSLIQGLCSTNNYRAAMQLFEEMKTKGLQPDEFTYNILINSLCSRGRLSDALGMLKEMESNRCARNIVTYNTLIDGFCKNRMIEQAEEVFDQMELLGVSRNAVTYNTLIDGLCKVRRVEDAMHVMEQMVMEGLKPNRMTYNSLLAHYCRAGDMERAADIVATMTSNGCEPDMVNYGTLIGGLCKAGRTHVAVTVLRSIQSKGMVPTPDVYNPVIQALFKRRVMKEAMTLFREMIQIGDPPNSITYKIVFRGLCNGGGPIGEAVDFAFEMMEHGVLPEFPSFYNLADGLCALSMESTLVRLVGMMVEKANVSEREASAITGFLKIGKFEDALGTLDHIFARRNPRRPYQWRA